MRAIWSPKADEDAERYRARTVERLRGLASSDIVDGGSVLPEGIQARIERLKAELEPDSLGTRGAA